MSDLKFPPMPINLSSEEWDRDPKAAMDRIRGGGCINLVDKDGKTRMQVVVPSPRQACSCDEVSRLWTCLNCDGTVPSPSGGEK